MMNYSYFLTQRDQKHKEYNRSQEMTVSVSKCKTVRILKPQNFKHSQLQQVFFELRDILGSVVTNGKILLNRLRLLI